MFNSTVKEPFQSAVGRTFPGMRDLLFEELDSIRQGKSTPQRLSAIARASQAIFNSVRVEMEYQRHIIDSSKYGTTAIPEHPILVISET